MWEDDGGTSDGDISVSYDVDSEHPSDDELFPADFFALLSSGRAADQRERASTEHVDVDLT